MMASIRCPGRYGLQVLVSALYWRVPTPEVYPVCLVTERQR